MRSFSRLFLLSSILYAVGVLTLIATDQESKVQANITNTNVVISQIQIAGNTTNDEFVELYNPTNNPIALTSWRLGRGTASATTSASATTLVSSISGTIQPKSYFLITSPESQASDSADATYSTAQRLASNNVIYLFSDAGQTIVDELGLGSANDNESSAFPENPGANESIVRKASAASTAESVVAGGSEATAGNGYDTDNNSTDFVLVETAFPRNSESPAAVTPTQGPTNTPTVTPTSTPANTPTPSATPTNTPTPTLTATPTPTNTPTPIATVTPTVTNTPTPTAAPTATPTVAPTPTITPTPSMQPTPTPEVIVDEQITNKKRFICVQTYRTISILGMHFSFPRISCDLITTN